MAGHGRRRRERRRTTAYSSSAFPLSAFNRPRLALSANRVFSLSSSNGNKSCALTIQIATDSSGTNVVTSGTCDLTVTVIF